MDLPNDVFELQKIVLAQRAVRDVMQKKIDELESRNMGLRCGLLNLYMEKHREDEWPCPNERGECICGLVEQNSDIDFYLDPSKTREEYQERHRQDTVWLRLNNLYDQYEEVSAIWDGSPQMIDLLQEQIEQMFNVLLDAQPWLVEEEDNDDPIYRRLPDKGGEAGDRDREATRLPESAQAYLPCATG